MIETIFNNIKTPYELLDFMSKNINYGYLGKSGRVYHFDDKDFNEKWYEEYILESDKDILKTLYGNCWDQVELERYWFEKNGYEVKTIFEIVNIDYEISGDKKSVLLFDNEEN